jgi:hypothetical protein
MNAWVEGYLRHWTTGRQMNWAVLLPMAEYAHNSWKHEVTKASPHKLLLGLEPQVNVKFLSDVAPTAVDRLRTLEEARKEAQMWLETLQKSKDDRKPRQLTQGDDVWLEAKNLVVKGMRKLLPKWYGPFKVLERIGQVVYRLKLPDTMKIHDVFHIDLLTPYRETSSYSTNYVRPPSVMEENDEEYKVENIRDARRHRRGRKLQYLVHWKGYPAADDSWVDHSDLNAPELLKEFYKKTPAGGQNV